MPKKSFTESPLMKFLPADAQAQPEEQTAKPAAPAETEKPQQITRQASEYKAEADHYEPRNRRVQLLMRHSVYDGIQYIAKKRKQSVNNLVETVLADFIEQTKLLDKQTKKG